MPSNKQQQNISLFRKVLLLLVFISYPFFANSLNLDSSSYKIENPTFNLGGGLSTSTNFKLFSNLGETAVGQSFSSGFAGRLGFLYFPIATSPVVSAVPGNAKVDLTWSASTATLANVTHYEVGTSTSLNGSYSYTNVGNVLLYTKTSLINNTTYYFKVRAYADGILLATSGAVSSTPVAPAAGGGGGGGGTTGSTGTGVIFSGRAYPLSKVSILKDGQLVITTIAGPDSNFTASLLNLSSGNYNFSVYGEDKNGVRSSSFTFPIYITSNVTTNIGGIFIAPTISVDKKEVKKGETIVVFGQSAQSSEITISINSEPEFFIQRQSDSNGVYLLNFDTSVLALGKHSARSKAAKNEEISPFSASVGFAVGSQNVLVPTDSCAKKGDLNADCRINLVDFSIAAFWYKKPLSITFSTKENEKLNGDNKIDLVDFSIMAFNWTG